MSAQTPTEVVVGMLRAMWDDGDDDAVERYFGTELQAPIAAHRAELLTGFDDFRVELVQAVAEGDDVLARLRLEGVHSGPFAGVEATGRAVSWESARAYRVADDRIVAAWGLQDRLGLLQQLGAVSEELG